MAKRHKYSNGTFTPSNPDKYVGPSEPRYRSSWELTFMRFVDKHPSVVSWASEPIKIPYLNPVTRKATVYIPDFLLVYSDVNGKRHQELVEVKPAKETLLSEAKTRGDKLRYAMNMAKWKAAANYCKKHGLQFRVINENEFFGKKKKK
jgi:hypothetical protein